MTYYSTLGVGENASAEQVASAFKRLAKKFHPDINRAVDAQEKFIEVFEAYEVLRDPVKRRAYDASLGSGNERGESQGGEFRASQQHDAFREQSRARAKEFSERSWAEFQSGFLQKIANVGKAVVKEGTEIGVSVLSDVLVKALFAGCCFVPIVIIAECSGAEARRERAKVVAQRNVDNAGLSDHRQRFLQRFPVVRGPYSLAGKKVVIMDESDREFAEMHFAIPAENRPSKESDVDYLLILRRSENVVGRYSDGASAIRSVCYVGIIDYKAKVEVAEKYFAGGDPPSTKRRHSSARGSDPLSDVEASIKRQLSGIQ